MGFDEVNSKVFSKYCQSCHGGQEQPLMNSYQTYKNEIRNVLQDVVIKKSMPKKKTLSSEEIALVKKWIDQGAREFGSGGVTTTTLPGIENQIGEANPNQLTRAEKEMISKWILDGQIEK